MPALRQPDVGVTHYACDAPTCDNIVDAISAGQGMTKGWTYYQTDGAMYYFCSEECAEARGYGGH